MNDSKLLGNGAHFARFMTAREVGEELGISRDRVYQMVREGTLHALRVSPRKLLFSRLTLDRMEQLALGGANGHVDGIDKGSA